MSKTVTTPPKSGKNGSGVREAQAEDLAVTLHAAAPDEAPSDLEGIPYLGETRRQALAAAGLRTRADLRAATTEQIGGVKGVGLGNAARVKEWLAVQAQMPNVAVATPLPVLDGGASALASANQNVQDVFEKIGTATARLKQTLPAKTRDKGLDRQLDKLDTVASELAEGPDTLSAPQLQEAVKTLDKIAALLESAAAAEKLSPKKQGALVEELRTRRRRLQKTLGD